VEVSPKASMTIAMFLGELVESTFHPRKGFNQKTRANFQPIVYHGDKRNSSAGSSGALKVDGDLTHNHQL
jgi:hypothetical protein